MSPVNRIRNGDRLCRSGQIVTQVIGQLLYLIRCEAIFVIQQVVMCCSASSLSKMKESEMRTFANSIYTNNVGRMATKEEIKVKSVRDHGVQFFMGKRTFKASKLSFRLECIRGQKSSRGGLNA